MADEGLTITGLQEAQEANNQAMAALRPSSAFGRGIRLGTAMAHRGVVFRAHVDTGTMRAAQRQEVEELRGRVFTDPGAVNRSGGAPAEYVFYEERRGGSHALYSRTKAEDEGKIQQAVWREIKRGMP